MDIDDQGFGLDTLLFSDAFYGGLWQKCTSFNNAEVCVHLGSACSVLGANLFLDHDVTHSLSLLPSSPGLHFQDSCLLSITFSLTTRRPPSHYLDCRGMSCYENNLSSSFITVQLPEL